MLSQSKSPLPSNIKATMARFSRMQIGEIVRPGTPLLLQEVFCLSPLFPLNLPEYQNPARTL